MPLDEPQATPNATNQAPHLEALAERLGGLAHARAAYVEPVVTDGITIVPVAWVRWSFGGGQDSDASHQGSGAGGRVEVTPIGYIELRGGKTRFRRIRLKPSRGAKERREGKWARLGSNQ